MPDNKQKSKIRAFWLQYEAKIVLIIGFILVAIIAFEAGVLKGQNWQQKPLIIEKPASASETCQTVNNNPSEGQNSPLGGQNSPEAGKAISQNPSTTVGVSCAFIGSRNSNKYHLSTCRWAKQIKPENIVCFKSTEDAVSKGYQPDQNCIK